MMPVNPFFDVKPLETSEFSGVIMPVTGAEFRWNPMVTLDDPVIVPAAGTTTEAGGAFYTMRTVVSGDATNGDIMLQGGTAGGIIVAEFLLYDASATSWAGTAGQHLQLKMTGDGSETSGILDPAFTVSTAVLSVVTTMGTDTYPSSGDLTGKFAHVSLGEFFDGGFSPAQIGNVPCSFCWSGYNTIR